MNNLEVKKLINLVNNEAKGNPLKREWWNEETWYADHSGELPVYIVDIITSEGLVKGRHDIMVYALQASNNVLVFLVPDYQNNEFGKKILAFNGELEGAVNRYAKLSVLIQLDSDCEYYTAIEDVVFVSDEEMEGGIL